MREGQRNSHAAPLSLPSLSGKKDSLNFSVTEEGESLSIKFRGPKHELHVRDLVFTRDGTRKLYHNPEMLSFVQSYVLDLGHPPTVADLVEEDKCLGCGGTDFGLRMVQCETCESWCHERCAIFKLKLPVPEGMAPWYCKMCVK